MTYSKTRLFKGKLICITKKQVFQAWQKVKQAGGAGGVDGISLQKFESNLKNNLYKIWNRMTSGSYFPLPVMALCIPKQDGGQRMLGIPTIQDRIAQQVVKEVLEPSLEKIFIEDNFGYRPAKSAHQAVDLCRKRCFKFPWVLDMDIKGFFDNMNHDLVTKAVEKHTMENWVLLYINRWLKSPIQLPDGKLKHPDKGTPQGGVISPLLANLFLHYVFDKWVNIHFPNTKFERYADDIIIHCKSFQEANYILRKVQQRMTKCNLELHSKKTKIVYCRKSNRKEKFSRVKFDFLGFRFQPRKFLDKSGKPRLGFGPAISPNGCKRIIVMFRKLKFHRATNAELTDFAKLLRPKIQGWINYYGKFGKWELLKVFRPLNNRLAKWLANKYKRFKRSIYRARLELIRIAKQNPNLFPHWKQGFRPG